MSSDETNYYRARCQAERSLAKSSTNPAVASIHEDMAALYEKLIGFEERYGESSVIPFDQARSASG